MKIYSLIKQTSATLSVLYRKHTRIISPVLSTSSKFLNAPGTAVPSEIFPWMWCGRGDSNSHGLGPTDFKSVMSTIPSRPHGRIAPGDSAGGAMMQKERIFRNKKLAFHRGEKGGDAVITLKKLAADDRADISQKHGFP